MKANVKFILPFTIVLLFLLVITQIFVIRKNLNAQNERKEILQEGIRLQKKEFENNVIISLTKVRDRLITINSESQGTYLEPVKQINPNYFVVSFYNQLDKELLDQFVKEEFESYNIKEEFQIGVYDCFTDSIIFDEFVSKSTNDTSKYKPQRWEHDGFYFGVYFTGSLHNYETEEATFPFILLIATILILVVVLFFGYTISSLYRQKKISSITTDFINNMTHELKTPIATIGLSVDVIKKSIPAGDESDACQRIKRYTGIIKTENKRLENQVERVLRIAKLERGDIKLNFETIDMHDVIEGCIETFIVPIQERSGELNYQLDATETIIDGDIIHITNIIYNLLDNANKYSPDNPIISIKTISSENQIKILISDSGKGIAKEDIKHIFDKFYRVSTGDVHNVKGFGLGLYYVKQMVQKHKGTIQAKSELGKGTTFELTFPTKQE